MTDRARSTVPDREVDQVFAAVGAVMGDEAAVEAATAVIVGLPCWTAPPRVEPLPGGISNLNFTAVCNGERYVVRYGADEPRLGVCRANEAAALRAAHEAGVGPGVFYAASDVIVMETLQGEATTPAALADPELLARVARALRVLHDQAGKLLDGPDFVLWPFHHGRWYWRQIERKAGRLKPHYVDAARGLGGLVDALEQVVGPCRIVFGHGDLVPGNVFRCADAIRFIDFEYAGFGPDLFDLAGLGMNAELDDQATDALLTSYYGTPPDPLLRRRYQAMLLMASIRESLWCLMRMIGRSSLAFDYSIYADMCLNRHERLFALYGSVLSGIS